jgi:hypothetical protein
LTMISGPTPMGSPMVTARMGLAGGFAMAL